MVFRQMEVTPESRTAVSRARFFLEKAKMCRTEERLEFEAFLEAAIVFARAAIHRLKTRYEGHPKWSSWWRSVESDTSITFFRNERNRILKQAAPKFGQTIFLSIDSSGELCSPPLAGDFYYFVNDPDVRASNTVQHNLDALERCLKEAENQFRSEENGKQSNV
jgi:hypothetical protein